MNRPHRRERTIDKQARSKSSFFSLPSGQLYNPYRPLEILTPEQVQQIHEASMHILEHTGIRFQDAEALSLWEQAGAKVDHVKQHVWIDRGLLMEWVAKAPQSFTVRARNPQRSRMIGGNAINFFPSAGMVFVRDLGRGHRPGQSSDALELVKLIQMTNVIDFAPVQSVVMHDVPVHRKHLVDQAMSYIHSDKPLLGTSHGRIIAGDGIEMAKIVFGEDLQPERGAVIGGNINVNSPLVYDERMVGGMITYARHGQFTTITPFILAGAMSPITILAAVAQQNAEALAGIALLQIVRAGAPAIYGGFVTNVDMKSGAPSFGTPEGAWALLMGAQLARHYRLPYRGSGSLNTANVPDTQAMGESLWALWPCVLAHTNLVIHAAGWLESGLTISYEKYITDVENLAMMQHFLQGVRWDGDVFALNEIHEVGPAGHHLGTLHTQERFETAFYPSFLADRRNLGTWQAMGAEDSIQRAHKLWQIILDSYEQPPMEVTMHEALSDFVERRACELEHVNLYG